MARNVPCGLRSRLGLEVLEETREDAEVRVAAYLSVVQCADHDVMTHIRRLLANEPINQGTVRRRPFHSPLRRGFYGFFFTWMLTKLNVKTGRIARFYLRLLRLLRLHSAAPGFDLIL